MQCLAANGLFYQLFDILTLDGYRMDPTHPLSVENGIRGALTKRLVVDDAFKQLKTFVSKNAHGT